MGVLSTGSQLLAEPIVLQDNFSSQNIGTHLEILEDPEGSLSFADILSSGVSNHLNWNQSQKSAVGFGFTKSAYWVKFTVENRFNRKVRWLLNQEYPLIDSIQVYIPDEKGAFKRLQLGDYQPFSQRPIIDKTFVIPIDSPPNTLFTYYLRYQTSSSLNIALKIWIPEAFEQAKRIELPLMWMFYGLLIALFAINLIILIYTREFAYLYYVLYIASFTLLMMSLSGVAFQYLWPEAIWWTNISNALFIAVVLFSIVQFSRHMIRISIHSRLIDLVLRIFAALSIVGAILTLIMDSYRFGIIASTSLTGMASSFGFYVAAYLAFSRKHKVREAKIFFVAFSIFLIGILLFVFKTFSILPINFVTTYAIQIGASFQIVLLTLVLPDRLNILKEKLTVLNESLEDQVKQRTAQLNSAQEKLLKTAHEAGMADMARDTMHSIGNIVNSMNISIERLDRSDESQLIKSFEQANELLRKNFDNLDDFILNNPMGKKLMEFYLEIENGLKHEQATIKDSIGRISAKIREIINVIAAQQEYVDEAYFIEVSTLTELLEDALESQSQNILEKGIKIEKHFKDVPKILIQTRKLSFVFSSLISNAIQAMSSDNTMEKKITLFLYVKNESIHFKIQDTGVGIPPEELKKIFRHGYSYHQIGKGLGLHSCANYLAEMKGKIWAESEGKDKGATFIVELPVNKE